MFLGFLLLISFALLAWLLYNNIVLAIVLTFASIIYIIICIVEGDELKVKSRKRKH